MHLLLLILQCSFIHQILRVPRHFNRCSLRGIARQHISSNFRSFTFAILYYMSTLSVGVQLSIIPVV